MGGPVKVPALPLRGPPGRENPRARGGSVTSRPLTARATGASASPTHAASREPSRCHRPAGSEDTRRLARRRRASATRTPTAARSTSGQPPARSGQTARRLAAGVIERVQQPDTAHLPGVGASRRRACSLRSVLARGSVGVRPRRVGSVRRNQGICLSSGRGCLSPCSSPSGRSRCRCSFLSGRPRP